MAAQDLQESHRDRKTKTGAQSYQMARTLVKKLLREWGGDLQQMTSDTPLDLES